MYIYTCVNIGICIYTCICIYIYINICIYMHAHLVARAHVGHELLSRFFVWKRKYSRVHSTMDRCYTNIDKQTATDRWACAPRS